MKKTLTIGGTVLAILASSGAVAQTQNVELYGIADVGLINVSGLRNNKTFLASGIMEGSRWGLRGNEDLGGGYRAIFTLESRVEIDTGSNSNRPLSGTQLPDRVAIASLMGLPSSMQPFVTAVGTNIANAEVGVNIPGRTFDRQAYLGLVTPVGAFLAGRMYTPAYELNANFDTMKTESSLAAGQVGSVPPTIDIRVSNALAYRIQLDGWTASLMYGAGETAGGDSRNRLLAGMVMYKTSAFSVGAAHNQRNNELGSRSLTSSVLGAAAKVGPGTLSAMWVKFKDQNPAGLSTISDSLPSAVAQPVEDAFIRAFKQDGDLMHMGYRYITGPNTISVAYTRLNDKRPNNADTESYGVAYTYSLSKRTDINAIVTRFSNKGLGQAAPGQAGFFGGVTDTAGKGATSVALGLRHRF